MRIDTEDSVDGELVARGPAAEVGGTRQPRPSVREVCLLGVSTPLAEGDRLHWSGRAYRVEASHPGYAHLAAEPDGAELR